MRAVNLVPVPACPLCGSRKGKRACPAKRAAICSVCCGEKRIVEIACPSGCVWLGQGIQNDAKREALDYLQHQDPRKGARWIRAVERFGLVLETIERAIAFSVVRDLRDDELLIALEAARKTFESETKGVVFESLPETPTLQALTRELVASVRSLVRILDQERAKLAGREESLPSIGPEVLAESFAVMGERCAYHVNRGAESGSLVEHLRRIHPRPGGPEESGPSRIVLA